MMINVQRNFQPYYILSFSGTGAAFVAFRCNLRSNRSAWYLVFQLPLAAG